MFLFHPHLAQHSSQAELNKTRSAVSAVHCAAQSAARAVMSGSEEMGCSQEARPERLQRLPFQRPRRAGAGARGAAGGGSGSRGGGRGRGKDATAKRKSSTPAASQKSSRVRKNDDQVVAGTAVVKMAPGDQCGLGCGQTTPCTRSLLGTWFHDGNCWNSLRSYRKCIEKNGGKAQLKDADREMVCNPALFQQKLLPFYECDSVKRIHCVAKLAAETREKAYCSFFLGFLFGGAQVRLREGYILKNYIATWLSPQLVNWFGVRNNLFQAEASSSHSEVFLGWGPGGPATNLKLLSGSSRSEASSGEVALPQ